MTNPGSTFTSTGVLPPSLPLAKLWILQFQEGAEAPAHPCPSQRANSSPTTTAPSLLLGLLILHSRFSRPTPHLQTPGETCPVPQPGEGTCSLLPERPHPRAPVLQPALVSPPQSARSTLTLRLGPNPFEQLSCDRHVHSCLSPSSHTPADCPGLKSSPHSSVLSKSRSRLLCHL